MLNFMLIRTRIACLRIRTNVIPCAFWSDDHFCRENHAVHIIVLLEALVRERVRQLKDQVGRLDPVRPTDHRRFEDEVGGGLVAHQVVAHQGGGRP